MDDYDLLQVSKYASSEEIRKAYKKRCLEVHPDKSGNADSFNQLKAAFDRVKNIQSLEQLVSRQDPLASRYCNSIFDGITEVVRREENGQIFVEKYKFHCDNTVTCEIVEIIHVL